jgi:glucuronokinase
VCVSAADDPVSRVIARVPARAALAGNPSDGYGGAVLAVPVGPLVATVCARPATTDRLGTLTADAHTPDGIADLLRAAVARFRAAYAGAPAAVDLAWATDIPRSVGLAGSSAIVTAALEALAGLAGASVTPVARAAMALAVEVDDLGIAAGPQDRVVQALAVPVLMDFAETGPDGMGSQRRVEGAVLDELFVAWSPVGAAPSGILHGGLRTRWAESDHRLSAAMAALAETAHAAASALAADDRAAFDTAVDESLRRRGELVDVDETTVRLAAIARDHGGSANSAGSGGAVVGRCDPDRRDSLGSALRRDGARLVHLGSSPSDPEAS